MLLLLLLLLLVPLVLSVLTTSMAATICTKLQVGVLYSENKEVVAMVSKMAHASQASSDTMDLVGRLFREPSFLDDYFTQHQASRSRLR